MLNIWIFCVLWVNGQVLGYDGIIRNLTYRYIINKILWNVEEVWCVFWLITNIFKAQDLILNEVRNYWAAILVSNIHFFCSWVNFGLYYSLVLFLTDVWKEIVLGALELHSKLCLPCPTGFGEIDFLFREISLSLYSDRCSMMQGARILSIRGGTWMMCGEILY